MRNRYLILNIFVFLGLIFLTIYQIPKALGYFYQSRGGDLLDQGLSRGSIRSRDRSLCLPLQNYNNSIANQIIDAVSVLKKAKYNNPNLSHVNLLLGRAYCSLGQPTVAVTYLSEYIQQRPNNPIGYLELGFAYKQAGDTDKANKQWEMAGVSSDEIMRINNLNWDDEGLSGEYENYLILDSFATVESWSPYPSNSKGSIYAENGLMVMTYKNNIDQRDLFGFSHSPQANISKFSEILIRMRGKRGTLFTLETVIDGVRKREFNYKQVASEWEVQSIPVTGEMLNALSIGIGEPDSNPSPERYELNLDWIILK